MEQTNRIKEILHKVNTGKASAEEIAEWQTWYNSFDDNKLLLSEDETKDQIEHRIWDKIQKQTVYESKTINWLRVTSVAASVLLASGFLYYKGFYAAENTDSVSAAFVSNGHVEQIDMSIKEFLDTTTYFSIATNTAQDLSLKTDKGNFTKVLLPDGTKVTLNANSKLILASGFTADDSKERIVRLEGEAYFDVEHDERKPFIVQLEKQAIRVLGTKFNVKYTADRKELLTSLYEGKIQLETGDKNIIVLPNQVVRSTKEHAEILDKKISVATDWRKLIFSFDQDLVEDVIDQLADRFNLEVILHSEIPKLRISGNLDKDLNVEELVQVMSNLTGGKYKLDGNKLTVKFNKTN